MRWEPVNYSEEKLVERLRDFRQPAHVRLEPGDGTRYDLVLIPELGGSNGLHTYRFIGGDPYSSEYVYPYNIKKAMELLAGNNTWSIELLTWWMIELFRKLKWEG
jgi:hypothetical protein